MRSLQAVCVLCAVIAAMFTVDDFRLTPRAAARQLSTPVSHGLTIPSGEFKLFWTPERLEAAKRWYSRNGSFSPRRSGHEAAIDHAFVYLMTGNKQSAQIAIDWAANFSFLSRGPGNEARWYGESQILVFSWLKTLFTAEQRRMTIERINAAIANDLAKSWGGAGDAANNFNWGFTRNALLWGIASYNETYTDPSGRSQRDIADGFIRHALSDRWGSVTAPFFNGPGRGGVLPEGSHYGPYFLDYFAVPLVTTRLLNRPLSRDTTFFVEAVFAIISATTPKPTHGSPRTDFAPRYQVFAYGDEQDTMGFPPAGADKYGTFMTVAAQEWSGSAVGQYARRWINTVRPAAAVFVRAVDDPSRDPGKPFESLPLDFYSPGAGHFYARDTWAASPDDKPTVILLQLGQVAGSHSHCDAGSFQILRNNRWLTRETPGRSVTYAGPDRTTPVSDMSIWAHNGITANNAGYGPYCVDKPAPRVLRVQSHPEYAYAAVDLSTHAAIGGVSTLIREFVYLRRLNALVTFDRVRSTSDVPKTFLLHFPTAPTIDGTAVRSVHASEELRVTSLTESVRNQRVTYAVVDESAAGSGSAGTWQPQHRLQATMNGSLDAYLVNVLHAKSVGASDVTSALVETPEGFSVTLRRPGVAETIVAFVRGMKSSGGSVTVGGTASPLRDGVQRMNATENGVVWE